MLSIASHFFRAAVLALALAPHLAKAESITFPQGNLSFSIEAAGSYQVSAKDPGWVLKGALPAGAKDLRIAESSAGKDAIGAYQELSFTFAETQGPITATVRLYRDKDLILFSQTSPAASATPPAPFPDFTTLPPDLFPLGFKDSPFSPPESKLENVSEPWLLFDQQDHALLISPASHFICARMLGDGKTRIASGFSATLSNLPAGFTQQTLLAVTHGINHAWDIWGQALTDLQGKKRPANDADPILKYYGYWTDNGGAYWYNYDPKKGYQGTMEALVDTYRAEQIPLRYLQLDSWWYHKTLTGPDGKMGKAKNSKLPEGDWNRYGGTVEYKAHPFIFPDGMEAFHTKVGLPFVTHNRWIDPTSPYHDRYKISGIAAIDPGFWNEIAGYLNDNGVIGYEQDWLVAILHNSPGLFSTVDEGDAFFDGMANGCKAKGLSVQYCMATPVCFLQGSKYGNLTSIRVSDDRFTPARYHDFLYTSRLAYAVGIWPWTDVFRSTEIDNLLLSTLSAGPVGTGDEIGKENKTNILQAVRGDGVIIKPDVPLLPTDASYLASAEHKNLSALATTYTDHDGLRTLYLAVVRESAAQANAVTVNASELGCTRPFYLYDYFAGTGQKLEAKADLTLALSGKNCGYFVAAPIADNGIAFLGDADKFVGTGKKRISSLRVEGDKVIADVVLADKETEVKLHGYATAAPMVSIHGGEAAPVVYDAAKGLFTVSLKPDLKQAAQMEEGDPIRKITVTLQGKT